MPHALCPLQTFYAFRMSAGRLKHKHEVERKVLQKEQVQQPLPSTGGIPKDFQR